MIRIIIRILSSAIFQDYSLLMNNTCAVAFQNVGVSFSVHLNKVRIDNAMKMLSTTRKTITDIAAMVGFNNVTYFVSTFKRYTGFTRVNIEEMHSAILKTKTL